MELHDYRQAVNEIEDVPRLRVASSNGVRDFLETVQQSEPGVVILVADSDQHLQVGLDGPYGFLRWNNKATGDSALAIVDPPVSEGEMYFLFEGTAEEVEPEMLLLATDVIAAAVHYFENRELAPWITWQVWNKQTNEWGILRAG